MLLISEIAFYVMNLVGLDDFREYQYLSDSPLDPFFKRELLSIIIFHILNMYTLTIWTYTKMTE